MTGVAQRDLEPGYAAFARFAYPPNELGYCGPADVAAPDLATHAREFDGAWPYLTAIAGAAGISDPLDEEVARSYWIGGALLDRVDPETLLSQLRTAFDGQVTGLLDDLSGPAGVLAHHSFHVFVVYPWVKFLDRDPATPVQVMQDCRIRWGTVESVDDEHVVMVSRPLSYDGTELTLGAPTSEPARWRREDTSLAPAPKPGDVVAAHWDWICGTLSDSESAALAAATQTTMDLVNGARNRS